MNGRQTQSQLIESTIRKAVQAAMDGSEDRVSNLVRKVIREELAKIGLDTSDEKKAEATRQNLEFLSDVRETYTVTRSTAFRTSITGLVGGFFVVILLGLKEYFSKN